MKKITKKYDVAVIGGGVAGVSAALQAARSGASTALIEKTAFFGGLVTSGLIYVYLPLCDGKGRQVTFGIAEELMRLGLKYGPGQIPPGWKTGSERYRCCFSPASMIMAMDEILEKNHVDLWLDSLVSEVGKDSSGRLRTIRIENKSGSLSMEAGCFIDSTGDADVVRFAGLPCHTGTNTLSIWALGRNPVSKGTYGFPPDGLERFTGFWPEEKMEGISGESVSRFLVRSRRRLREEYERRFREGADAAEVFPVLLPSMANFRTTFSIVGKRNLADGDAGIVFDDSVGLLGDWRRNGPVWEVPFGSLLPKEGSGVLAAGRCVAAMGDAWEITRVIPAAAMTGQVAGLAAALAVDIGIPPEKLPYPPLEKALRKLGFPLHRDEL